MSTIIPLPYYDTGRDDGAEVARLEILSAPGTTIYDLAVAANTHHVETLAILAAADQNLGYEHKQNYKAGYITGYQGAILAAIGERATISEEATLAL